MTEVCEWCGSAGTVRTDESGIFCTACGTTAALPALTATPLDARTNQERDKTIADFRKKSQTIERDKIMKSYAYTLQLCLQDMVQSLIQKGVNPAIKNATKQIWFRTIQLSGALEPGFVHEATKKFSPLTSEFPNLSLPIEAREEELKADDRIYNHFASYSAILRRILDIETILWVLYAALIWTQEAVTPVDLSLWVSHGDLSYMKISVFLEKAEARYKARLPKIVFSINSPPRPLDIAHGATSLCKDIGLKLPAINVPLLIFRHVSTLDLPWSIGESAIRLYEFYWKDSSFDKEDPDRLYYPHLVTMSCILAAMKMTFGLDGVQRQAEGNRDWLTWAEQCWTRLFGREKWLSPSSDDIMQMSPEEVRVYCQHFEKTLLAAHAARQPFKGLNRRISGLVEEWQSETNASVSTDDGRGRVPRRPERIEFRFEDKAKYVPPQYLFPWDMYWFASWSPNSVDSYFPVDFAAVLSVLSALVNVKPKHLVCALASLENQMLRVEMDLHQMWLGKDRLKESDRAFEVSAAREKTMLNYAAHFFDLSKLEQLKLAGLDIEQSKKVVECVDECDPSEPSVDGAGNMPDSLCKRGRKRPPEPTKKVPSEVEGDNINDFAAAKDNPAEVLRLARVARQLGQFIVSLD